MKVILPLLSLLFIPPVSALEVLGVVGSVVPAKPYYESLLKRPTGTSFKLNPSDSQRAKRWAGDYSYDSNLTSGSFSSFVLNPESTKSLIQPLCLVSNDQRSKEWLAKNLPVLKEVNAVCYLVESTGESDLNALRQSATNIRFFALDPTLLITKFGVPYYPALISKRGVEQ